MRPGSVRDHNSTDNLHQAQKRLVRRVQALEDGGGSGGDGASVQALKARIDALDARGKKQADALRGQILALRAEISRLKGKD